MPTPEAISKLQQLFSETQLKVDWAVKDLILDVECDTFKKLCLFLRRNTDFDCDFLADITSWDTGESFPLWYRFHSMSLNHTVIVRTNVPRDNPIIASVTDIWPGADWLERECFDMYGIDFEGHPFQGDLAQMRILMPKDWDGFPFRKDYEPVFSGDPLHGPQERN